jgi:hypothetical protein
VVKLGTHEKPRNEVIPSKEERFIKNMALILVDGKQKKLKAKFLS